MKRKALLAVAMVVVSLAAQAQTKCTLQIWSEANLKKNGYTIHPLDESEKARFINFERRVEGEPDENNLDALAELPGFAVYQTAGCMGSPCMPNKGAFLFTDPDQRCILYSLDLGGTLTVKVLRGTWRFVVQ